MKVFVDSNVLISAFAFGGVCGQVQDLLVEGKFKVLISELVLAEVKAKLSKKFHATEEEIGYALTAYKDYTVIKNFAINSELESPDPNDLEILAAALAGRAKYFITGDKALLEMQQIDKMIMISPREFLTKYYLRS